MRKPSDSGFLFIIGNTRRKCETCLINKNDTSIRENSQDNRSTYNEDGYLYWRTGIYVYSTGRRTSNGSYTDTRRYCGSTYSSTSSSRAGSGTNDRSRGSSTTGQVR